MEAKILKAKEWVKGQGMYPTRIVLLEIIKGAGDEAWIEYSTHCQAEKEDGNRYIFWGHYFKEYNDALIDFVKRMVN